MTNRYQHDRHPIYDPFVVSVDRAIGRLSNSIQPDQRFDEHRDVLISAVGKLVGLWPNFYAQGAADRAMTLPQTFASFQAFESAYDEAQSLYLSLAEKAASSRAKAELKLFAKGLEPELQRLRQLHTNITPLHLQLQAHFVTLVTLAYDGQILRDTEETKFLAPLTSVRDQFFLSPRASHPAEYMKLSQELQASFYYKEMLLASVSRSDRAEMEPQLAEHELELEIQTMVRELS
jgi:hypothetical protein